MPLRFIFLEFLTLLLPLHLESKKNCHFFTDRHAEMSVAFTYFFLFSCILLHYSVEICPYLNVFSTIVLSPLSFSLKF